MKAYNETEIIEAVKEINKKLIVEIWHKSDDFINFIIKFPNNEVFSSDRKDLDNTFYCGVLKYTRRNKLYLMAFVKAKKED